MKLYTVPSFTDKEKTYAVRHLDDDTWRCSCPRFILKGEKECKHITHVKAEQMAVPTTESPISNSGNPPDSKSALRERTDSKGSNISATIRAHREAAGGEPAPADPDIRERVVSSDNGESGTIRLQKANGERLHILETYKTKNTYKVAYLMTQGARLMDITVRKTAKYVPGRKMTWICLLAGVPQEAIDNWNQNNAICNVLDLERERTRIKKLAHTKYL